MAKMENLTDRTRFRRILVRAVVIPLVVMAVLLSLFWWQINDLLSATRWVEHTDQALTQAYSVRGLLIDMETGVRGYLLTGSQQFLDPYQQATSSIETMFDRLAQLVSDNPTQTGRLVTLRQDTETWRTYANNLISLKDSGGVYDTQAIQLQGKQLMDRLRAQISTFITTEMSLRDTRSQTVQTTTVFVIIAAVLGTVVLGILLGIFTSRQLIGVSRRYGDALTVVNQQADLVYTQREWLQGALSSIGDAVIATDIEGNISFINEVAQALTGWYEPEATGKPLATVFQIYQALTHEPIENPFSQVIRIGTAIHLADQVILTSRDGKEIPIDDSASPIRNANKALIGVVLVFRDITERKSVEATLRASDQRYRGLADSLPLIVWTAQSNGIRDYFNRRWFEYTGLTYDQSVDWGWRSALHPDDVQRCVDLWRNAIESHEGYDLESRWRRAADNTYRWHLSRTTPVHDAKGQLVLWVGTLTDIDSQKQIELVLGERSQELERTTQRLEERNAELDQFAYVTSHDLKAPLRGIANLSQWIEEDLGDSAGEEIHKQMDLLRGRVHRMEGLIDGMLQYSRVGRVKNAIVPVDLNTLFSSVVDLLAVPPGFTVEIPPNLPTIRTDQLMLQQVASNLISNAVKHHGSPEGHIWIKFRELAIAYEFCIADDGQGIAPEYHQKIFVIFQTLESRDKVEGSGLGLALVKKIVEDQGGKIWLESAPGMGSKFYFTWQKRHNGDTKTQNGT